MPPKKTYRFVNIHSSDISITIESYSLEQAMLTLSIIVKNPSDFKYD